MADAITEYEDNRGRAKGARRIASAFRRNLTKRLAATQENPSLDQGLRERVTELRDEYWSLGAGGHTTAGIYENIGQELAEALTPTQHPKYRPLCPYCGENPANVKHDLGGVPYNGPCPDCQAPDTPEGPYKLGSQLRLANGDLVTLGGELEVDIANAGHSAASIGPTKI